MGIKEDRETETHTLNISGCARCGERHKDLEFTKLTRPHQPWDDVEPYTHWTPCPTNDEPIMLAFAEEDEPGRNN